MKTYKETTGRIRPEICHALFCVYLSLNSFKAITINHVSTLISDKIAPVCLPLRGAEAETLVGIDMVTAGWGKTGSGEKVNSSVQGDPFARRIRHLSTSKNCHHNNLSTLLTGV